MDILSLLTLPETWQTFLAYKTEKQAISPAEADLIRTLLEQDACTHAAMLSAPDYEPPLPTKKEISKEGSLKKRTVYCYPEEFQTFLKLITFLLYRYDDFFSPNCYAFRRHLGAADAIRRLHAVKDLPKKYCLKTDIHNYFNSIPPSLLLEKLRFLQKEDAPLYRLFEKLLTADACYENGVRISEKRGAMAGIPVSPFFANVYLACVDAEFYRMGHLYFRYSDDILLFADSAEDLTLLQTMLYERLSLHRLTLNPDKLRITAPGEPIEFLGFSYENGSVDLSPATIRKVKAKIRRKAHALRRWQSKKGLSGDKAAKGFIHAMNCKFYADRDPDAFTWSRWFFPSLTTTKGLAEIDSYMQQYIRYTATGRHAKSNYRIRYRTLKEWGYRSLVHEYYSSRLP